MRDIIFRGKQVFDGTIGNNKMVYGDLFTSPNGNITYIITKLIQENNGLHINKQIKVDRDTVSQFTEMLDMQEQKIFEGDILRVVGKTAYPYVEVFKKCGSWEVQVYKEPTTRSLYVFLKDNECVVIGNVFNYDDREFLEYKD